MHRLSNFPPPRWLTYQTGSEYCGISIRTLQNYENAGLIVVANVIQPGAKRGRKLIDRESLDRFIMESVGTKTQIKICPDSSKDANTADLHSLGKLCVRGTGGKTERKVNVNPENAS